MNAIVSLVTTIYGRAAKLLDLLQPVGLLGARLYIAWVFFAAGLTKIKDWDTTLWLFEEEYNVPFLNHELAAFLGTAGELVLPILLVLGLATRFGALGLTLVNIIAVVSLEEIAPAAYILHVLWGVLIAQIALFGPGFFSADNVLKRKFG